MKMKFLSINLNKYFFLMVLSFLAFYKVANAQTPSTKRTDLTVFAKEGQPFWLVINGARQNDKPLTQVKVVGLTQEFVRVRAIFQDEAMKPLDAEINLQPIGKGPFDLVYEIRKSRLKRDNGAYFILQHSWRDLGEKEQDDHLSSETPFKPSEETPTFEFTQDAPKPLDPSKALEMTQKIVEQQMQMTKEIVRKQEEITRQPFDDEPRPGAIVHKPTKKASPQPSSVTPEEKCKNVLAPARFNTINTGLRRQRTASTRASFLKSNVLNRKECFTSAQVVSLVKAMSLETERFNLAKDLIPKISDIENVEDVIEEMSFTSSKNRLRQIVADLDKGQE